MESKIRQIITQLNIATSSNIEHEKHEELKAIYKQLLPYAEVEEELGIDLITLFKALKNGVYSNHYAYAGEEIHKIDVELQKRSYGLCVSGGFGEGHNIKDYGKTWALTKEELEVKL